MLPGQNLRGRHQRALIPRPGGQKHGSEGQRRFSAAHIPLHQPSHGLRRGQIGGDFGQHPLLCSGGREGEGLPVGPAIRFAGGDDNPRFSLSPQCRGCRLIQQHPLKGDAPQGQRQVFPAVRKMGLTQGKIPLAQLMPKPQGGGQRFGAAVLQLGQGLTHQLPHGLGRNAAHGPVNGQNAPLLHPLGGYHPHPALLVPVHPAIERQLLLRGKLALQPGLIKPDHRQRARFIAQPHGDGGHSLEPAEPGRGLEIPPDADFPARNRLAQGRDGFRVLIAKGQG